jgi:hypothetical protein
MKRSTEKEMMDLPGNPKALLVEDLRNLRIINRYLGGYRGVIKGLKRLVGEGRMRRFSLLDVGTGSADIPKVIVQWARNRGIAQGCRPNLICNRRSSDKSTRKSLKITIFRGDGRPAVSRSLV